MSDQVGLTLESTLANAGAAELMAKMYLPDGDIGNRWALDKVTWLPSDASLAALPFPVTPDTDDFDLTAVPPTFTGVACYVAQVVLDGIPEEINPAGDGQGFIGGTLAGASLKISRRRVTVEIAIARRIPNVYPDSVGFFVSPADLAADFPTITPPDVDAAISAYDARLAHP